MGAFRRRLAAGALALAGLQLAVLFAIPLSACCVASRAGHRAAAAAEEADCCPPGSHAPGECPLRRSKDRGPRTESSGIVCRMMCNAPRGPQVLLGAIGLVPEPRLSETDPITCALHAGAPSTATARPSLPEAPPPRLL